MTTPGVRCDHVWKKFSRGEHHDSLRDLIPAVLRRIRGSPADAARGADRAFWAVQDVSFEVRPGQALGIIGPNGAGKSTMLKLLTRILRPTQGTIEVVGRQGALIEVAAGFHPDLTGRENVYLQGAIMGMSLPETARKFDQIVEFAGVSEFIDTPVKRYSSGMNARLGFAIAAHLDPDTLFIDEVLAVGDVRFQQKAFERIHELATSGIPVVVVSHQLDRVAQLCTHALLLNHGRVVKQGTPGECIAEYLNPGGDGSAVAPDSPVAIESVCLVDRGEVRSGDVARVRVRGRIGPGGVPADVDPVVFRVQSAATGTTVCAIQSTACGITLAPGEYSLDVSLQMNVPRGIYLIQVGAWNLSTELPLAAGPTITLQVAEGVPFLGSVQLNCSMERTGVRPQ